VRRRACYFLPEGFRRLPGLAVGFHRMAVTGLLRADWSGMGACVRRRRKVARVRAGCGEHAAPATHDEHEGRADV
jgi:hypothetical protein